MVLQARDRLALAAAFLGRPRLRYAGKPLALNAPPKTLSLLAYLLLAGAPVERDRAAFALWPDVAETDARANLRRHLLYLERALPPLAGRSWISRDDGSIGLHPQVQIESDVEEFTRLCAPSASESDLRRACELCEGELLEGLDEEWIVPERTRLYEMRLDALERLTARFLQNGDLASATAAAGTLGRLEPWREDYVRLLMRVRYRAGDRCGAIGAFRDFAARLHEAYAIAPAPQTVELRDRIEANEPLDEISGNLPVPLAPFVGREQDVAQVLRRMETARLVTLVGIAGVGKTRLALHVAERSAARFPDGVWFADVAAAGGQPDLALAHARDVLPKDPVELRAKNALLVLDNCEGAAQACGTLVRGLLGQSRGLRILATSRIPLHVDGESLWRVDPFCESDAQQFFSERAAATNKVFCLTQADRRLVARICAKTDGLALALELAAARLEAFSLQELERQLDAGEAVTSSLSAALAWTYGLLDARAQAFCRRLTVFTGGWSAQAVDEICGGEAQTPSATATLLASLVEGSLVLVDTERTPARFRMLKPLREHLQRLAQNDPEFAQIRLAHARYYAACVERTQADPISAWPQSLAFFECERANCLAALALLLDEGADPVRGARMVLALSRYWRESGMTALAREWIEKAIAHVHAQPDLHLALLHALASLTRLSGAYRDALALYEDVVARAGERGEPFRRADALFAAAFTAMKCGDFDLSRRLAAEALEAHQALDNERGVAHVRNTLGAIELNQQRFAQARREFEAALGTFESVADVRNAGIVIGNLGLCAYYEGQFDAADELFAESLRLSREAGNKPFAVYVLQQRGDLRLLRGRTREAAAALSEALDGAERIGDRESILRVIESCAIVAGIQGRRAATRCLLAAALAARETFGIPLQAPERTLYERRLALLPFDPAPLHRHGAMPFAHAAALAHNELAQSMLQPA